ncbi:MAG TPA: adenylate/guanylate cyclase domain-containing protein, partial [Myxococcota bacterium]|nr:adenylate/guanylate cyclase domain-containing protein [Myxococcota bacterium]
MSPNGPPRDTAPPAPPPADPHGVERKRSTVVFADLVGFNAISERAGAERAWGALTRCLTLIDGVARRHGAAVDKFLGDALMAVFGHPIAVDDPERRALRAALEMRRTVRDFRDRLAGELPGFDGDLPLDVQIGVNTGEVVFGDLGDVRREFSILGDPVNVAARFKSKAGPGGIYVGPETREAAGAGFAFRELEPLVLKGKAKPVPASELVATRDDPTAVGGEALEVTGFVGRDAERASLVDAARAVAAGRGGMRAVVGAAGTGKSRLVAEAARAATELPLAWRVARARPGDAPLEAFAPLVRHFAALVEDEPGSAVRQRLRAALGRHAPSAEHDRTLACLLRVLGRGTRGREGRPLEGLTPEAYRAVLVESVVTVIEAIAERGPMVLVLEDWQWAEPASRQAVRALSGVAARRPVGVWVVGRELPDLPAASVATVALDALAASEAQGLVGALAEARSLPDDVRALVLERGRGNPMETVLAAFLAPALQADARRAREERHRERETERRRTTVLFADLSGFTSLSERAPIGEVYAAVTSCLDRLHRVALKHGGSVDKHMGDCVMAVFGFPEAMEDSSRAAVNAAIEMLREVEAFNAEMDLPSPLEVHTGIETGLTIAGSIEGSVIGEFALMGDAAKAADRLTDLAEKGQIFVGEEARRATADAFAYEPREAFRLTDQSSELASFELLSRQEQLHRTSAKPASGFTSQLVGREAESRAVEGALEALATGRGGVVSVLGEAGIGKSRLLEDVRGRAGDDRIAWLESRSLAIGRSLPFHTFADLLSSWAGRADDEADTARAWWEATRALLGERVDEVAPYLLTIADLPVPEPHQARLDALAGDAMEKLVLRAFTEWLRALSAQRPLVLVFDDLYWADLSSIELLEPLLRLTADHPILFVALSRTHYAETSDHVLEVVRERYADRHVELHLEPLGAEACRQLIRNLFRGADVPARLRHALEEKAAGNPLFVEEVVRSLLAEGSLVVEAGELRATERIADAEVPGSVQEVVLARIDRLAPGPRALLQVASALGRAFEEGVLAAVLERDDVSAELASLADAEMLARSARAGAGYEFKHPLIQETAYDSILQARREELHRRIGEVMEGTLSEAQPGRDATLAYHFGRGRDAERAERYLFRAGDEAARASASNEALRFFEEASRLFLELHGETGDPRKMATLEGHIARAYANRGQLIEAVLHYDDALRHLGERVPGDREILFRVAPLLL